MTQQMVMEPKVSTHDDLDRVRTATQELHQAITSVIAKRAAATKADAEELVRKAKESVDQANSAIRSHYDAAEEQVKPRLEEAAAKLTAAHKQLSESVQRTGQDFHDFLAKALTDARASASRVSEAIAAKRSEIAGKQNPSTPQS